MPLYDSVDSHYCFALFKELAIQINKAVSRYDPSYRISVLRTVDLCSLETASVLPCFLTVVGYHKNQRVMEFTMIVDSRTVTVGGKAHHIIAGRSDVCAHIIDCVKSHQLCVLQKRIFDLDYGQALETTIVEVEPNEIVRMVMIPRNGEQIHITLNRDSGIDVVHMFPSTLHYLSAAEKAQKFTFIEADDVITALVANLQMSL
jgi:hypothetical protein